MWGSEALDQFRQEIKRRREQGQTCGGGTGDGEWTHGDLVPTVENRRV